MSIVNRRKPNRRKRKPRDWSGVFNRTVALLRRIVVIGVLAAVSWGVVALLDRPVNRFTIEGPFQRVTAMQIEAVLRDHLPASVLSADLKQMRADVTALDWVDRVSIERRWPDGLHVTISEQIPAARWSDDGLLNTRGELFLREARQIPAELPRLDGPPHSEWQVAQRYLAMRDRLLKAGFSLSALTLDARGAWRAQLSNGIEVRLGREESDRRIALFVDVVAPMIAMQAQEIAYVDMRYSNGFAIGWQEGAPASRTAEVRKDA